MSSSEDTSASPAPRGGSSTFHENLKLAVAIVRYMKSAPQVDIAALAEDYDFPDSEAAHQAVNRALKHLTNQDMVAQDANAPDTDDDREEEANITSSPSAVFASAQPASGPPSSSLTLPRADNSLGLVPTTPSPVRHAAPASPAAATAAATPGATAGAAPVPARSGDTGHHDGSTYNGDDEEEDDDDNSATTRVPLTRYTLQAHQHQLAEAAAAARQAALAADDLRIPARGVIEQRLDNLMAGLADGQPASDA